MQAIREAQDINQPLRTIKVKGDQEWKNTEKKQLIRKRQRLHCAGEYTLRNELAHHITTLIKKRKKSFYQDKYSRNNTDMWSHANKIRKPSATLPSDPEFGERLNEQFSDVIWEGISKADLTKFIVHETPKPSVPIFNFTNVGEQLRKVKSTSAGPDGISGKLLHAARLEIISPLVHIFNHCINNGIVIDEWRLGNITPIPKVPNPSEPSDMRPIAITSTPCKIIERIISKHILTCCREQLVTNKQFGFLPRRSTTDALIKVLDDWGRAIDDGHQKVISIFFDFAKAFDLVDHVRLLFKITPLLPQWLINWIVSWLSDRKQRVIFKGTVTCWRDVMAGVVQGSVLGRTLFLLFILDINDYLPDGVELLKYADDILAYIIGSQTTNLPQDIVNAVQSWCTDNKMRLNDAKCKVMIINPPLLQNPYPVTFLLGQTLEVVKSYKYLGFTLSDTVNPDLQWNRVRSIISPV